MANDLKFYEFGKTLGFMHGLATSNKFSQHPNRIKHQTHNQHSIWQCSLIKQSTAYHMVPWIFKTNVQGVSKLQQGFSIIIQTSIIKTTLDQHGKQQDIQQAVNSNIHHHELIQK